jgi:three-Cys-motif partner protein
MQRAANLKKRIADVGLWSSAEKLEILRCYLGSNNGFLKATQRAQRRFYIDLFAGPGQNRVRETAETIDGSPIIALRAGPPEFTHLYWVDADPRNAASLRAHASENAGRGITIFEGDANQRVDDILAELPTVFPVFAFLDPRGTELKWDTVAKLARHKAPGRTKIELFMLFAYNQCVARLMPYDQNKMISEHELDEFMPDPQRWRAIYEERVARRLDARLFRRAMLAEYVRGLTELGYKFVPEPRLISTPDNHPLYFMLFASDNEAGWNIMTWCLRHVRDSRLQPSWLPYAQQY